MLIETKILPPGAVAFTAWPFVIIKPGLPKHEKLRILLHESVHMRQQYKWLTWGLGVGLLVWFFLYLLVLPVWWNPWRYTWEAEAMTAEGKSPAQIKAALKRAPYWLWL